MLVTPNPIRFIMRSSFLKHIFISSFQFLGFVNYHMSGAHPTVGYLYFSTCNTIEMHQESFTCFITSLLL